MTIVLLPEWLFDGESETSRPDMAIIVDGDRISGVERAAGLPGRTQRIEYPSCTLLPGLIDAHVHICMDPSPVAITGRPMDPARLAVQGMTNAAATLRGGVTTVRCVGTPGNVDLVLRDAIAEGRITGPRIVAAGKTIAMTGGHGYPMAIEADGADAVIAAVRTQVKAGVDVIKLMVTGGVLTPGGIPGTPQMLPEELAAAISVAHRAGRRVCGHAEGPEGVRDAILAGIDSIEHGYFVELDPLFDEMKVHPTWVVPTLVAYAAILEQRDLVPRESVANAELAIQRHQESFRYALAAGAPIAMGSDAGTPGNPHGENWREIALMVAQGMSPGSAVKASTFEGARLLGIDDIGSISASKRADLLIVRGNPLDDIAALRNVERVWKNGEEIGVNR